jgi:hypothetical protein
MPDDGDFLWRPVLEGIYSGESLEDGKVDLVNLADAHDALDVKAENQRRADAALRRR